MMRRRRRETLPRTVAERVKRHIENEQTAESRYNEKLRTENDLVARIASWRAVDVQTVRPPLSFDTPYTLSRDE